MEVGSTRRREKSVCFPGNAWVRGASRIGRPCAARPAPGIVESIVLAPKSTGSSTAKLLAGSSATKNTFLSGHRTSRPLHDRQEVRDTDSRHVWIFLYFLSTATSGSRK